MKMSRLLLVTALVASCHLDDLLQAPGGTGSPGTRLVFTAQPAATTAGQPLGPIAVTVLDSLDQPVADFGGPVTITIRSNPGGGNLSGDNTVEAVDGVATFSGLSIDKAGTGYTLQATATGAAGTTSTPFNIMAPGASNQPPTASFTHSCTDLTCLFIDTSSDPDGQVMGWSWSFGDGGTATSKKPSHTYGQAGSYTVEVTVTDNEGATDSFSDQVTVSPAQPATGSLVVTTTTTGLSLDLDGYTVTVDDTQSKNIAHTGEVTFTGLAEGNHSVALSSVEPNCTVVTPHPRTVSVTGGATTQTDFTITCTALPSNQTPSVSAGGDQRVLLGVLYTLNASFIDPDNGPWRWRVDWGDGGSSSGTSTSPGSISPSHTYVLGIFTITVTVWDSRDASSSDSKELRVVLVL